MKLLPFGWTLSGLTLKGKHRDIAQAYYELEGEALERKILKIEISNKDEYELAELKLDRKYDNLTDEQYDIKKAKLTLENNELDIKLLEIERKYKHITKEEYDYKLIDLKYKESVHTTDLPFARYSLDKKYGKLTEKEFDKAVYSLGNRPWIDIIHSEYNDGEKSDGFVFEFDWNDAFIKMLREEGYHGATEEEVVEQWFEDKALDTYMGVLSEQIAEIGEDPIDAHARSSVGARTVREAMENKRSRHS